MEIFNLIIEQIKSTYPSAITYHDIPNKKGKLTLAILPFGKIIITDDLNIVIDYLNPYSTNFKTFESYFKSRMKFEGYETYIYQKKIHVYKRSLEASNNFEYAIKRANSFIEVARCIEKFIEWNESLYKKQ